SGIRVTKHCEALPKVHTDKHKVLQILLNLLSNARHALEAVSAEQRHLQLRLHQDNGSALLQVIDSGMGLAPEHLPRLFSQGFTTRKSGHGLGLHSSALAAQLLKGRLTLESPGPGQGATATLCLPLLPPGPSVSPLPPRST
ncbi:ATP-binding protein, partial [Archangium sp.]|uniref:ATP-binding protein n=1 Tax=Archangium sp. TaxID=1872627 RepID=UPI002D2FBCDE